MTDTHPTVIPIAPHGGRIALALDARAASEGIDPAAARAMTLREFCSAIAARRALRDADRLTLAVAARGRP